MNDDETNVRTGRECRFQIAYLQRSIYSYALCKFSDMTLHVFGCPILLMVQQNCLIAFDALPVQVTRIKEAKDSILGVKDSAIDDSHHFHELDSESLALCRRSQRRICRIITHE